VTCERNAGDLVLRCLESVYSQDYSKGHVRHVFIDDASTDETPELIKTWLNSHPGHQVQFIANQERVGGTANTVKGFSLAPEESIVLELNGDDWLPDEDVLAFLNKVYAADDVWMTYNTLCYPNGQVPTWARPYPARIVRENSFREYPDWPSSHLHTFRQRLFQHIHPETFIDPETGEYWESADDQAIYLAMLELSGIHARHLNRVTYVYNFWENSHSYEAPADTQERALRIRQGRKYTPLARLDRDS
jgi:glycosyltransferase involved in cell wall biosynthesis